MHPTDPQQHFLRRTGPAATRSVLVAHLRFDPTVVEVVVQVVVLVALPPISRVVVYALVRRESSEDM